MFEWSMVFHMHFPEVWHWIMSAAKEQKSLAVLRGIARDADFLLCLVGATHIRRRIGDICYVSSPQPLL